MLYRGVLSLSLGIVLSGVACGDNVITEWGGAQAGYEIYQDPLRIVLITAPGTYKFQALDPNGPGGLGIINQITVAASCPSGTVTVSVVRNPSEVGGATKEPGVNELKEINLNRGGWPPDPNVIGVIEALYTAGDLGAYGQTWATTLAGTMTVGQGVPGGATVLSDITVDQLDGALVCNSLGSLYVTREGWDNAGSVIVMGDWYGSINVAGSLGSLDFQGFAGGSGWGNSGIYVSGNLGQAWFEDTMATTLVVGDVLSGGDLGYLYVRAHEGQISVRGSIDEAAIGATAPSTWWEPSTPSMIWVRGNIATSLPITYGHGGILEVHGSIAGLQIGTLMDGNVYVEQGLGPVVIGEHLRGALTVNSDLTSGIVVGGDLTGTIDISGGLGSQEDPITDLSGGYIIVNGSFVAPGHIYTNRLDPNSTAFIAIDYDGWDDGHDWGSNDPGDANNANVFVGSAYPYFFYANNPALHIWHITECRGDMNNDGIVSYADINGFTLALSQPGVYAVRYPGLGGVAPDPNTGGSRVYHGDMNCDGEFTYGDINPFVVRLDEECCDPNCGACGGGNLLRGGGQRLSPQALATRLTLNIDPDLYDELVEIARQAAAGLDDAGDRAYWQAVYGYLAE